MDVNKKTRVSANNKSSLSHSLSPLPLSHYTPFIFISSSLLLDVILVCSVLVKKHWSVYVYWMLAGCVAVSAIVQGKD